MIKQQLNHFLFIICCSFLMLAAFQFKIQAQMSIGGQPPSFLQPNLNDSVPEIVMPPVNNDSLLDVDSAQQNGQSGSFRYGFPIDVDFGIYSAGVWDTLINGGRLWRLVISSPGAYSINLIYDNFYMPQGALFYVYNLERTQILGAYTFINNKPGEKFATGLVQGDTVILELYEPPQVIGQCRLNVSRVIHAFKKTGKDQGNPGASDNCNIGVNCALGEPWCIEKRSVVLITNDNGALCSGALVNNVNNDLTPYVLTANHCLDEQDVSTWIFHVQYWDPDCDNIDEVASPIFGKVGGTLRANNAFSDFALIELFGQIPPGTGVHYAGWDNSFIAPQSGTYIHHPSGDLMKISSYNQPAQDVIFGGIDAWRIILFEGVVEGGSSGAPLFNQNRLIVGQHRGRDTSDYMTCDNPDGPAFSGKFSTSWGEQAGAAATQLLNWLDPDFTGMPQMPPTATPVYLINRTITGTQNFTSLNRLSLEGNVSVTPLSFWITFCQPNQVELTTQPGSSVVFKSQDRVIIRKGVRLLAGSSVRVRTGAINCANDNLVKGDWINIFCNTDATLKTTPFAFDDEIWSLDDNISQDEKNDTPDYEDNNFSQRFQSNLQIYPNPSIGKFIIKVDISKIGSLLIIQDVLGRSIIKNVINSSFTFVDISSHSKGMYFVKVIMGDEVFVDKIVYQ